MKAAIRILIKEFYELGRRPNLLAWLALASLGFLWLAGNLKVHDAQLRVSIAAPAGLQSSAQVLAVREIVDQFSNTKSTVLVQGLDPISDAQATNADVLLSKPDSWNAPERFTTDSWAVFNATRPGPRQEAVQALCYEIAFAIRANAPWHLVLLNSLYGDGGKSKVNAPVPVFALMGGNALAIRWLVPSFLALMTLFVPFLIACNCVARERELGTLEQLLVSPNTSWETFILGKALLPILTGLSLSCVLLLAAGDLFGFPVRGGVFTILFLQSAGVVSSTALGLAVAGMIENQLQGYFLAAAYLLSSILLTGLLFPLSDADTVVKIIAPALPLTWTYEPLADWMLAGNLNNVVVHDAAIALTLQVVAFSIVTAGTLALARRRI